MDGYLIRKIKDRFMRILVYLALVLALIPLFSVLGEVVVKGLLPSMLVS